MTTLAPRSLLASLGRHLVAALNAWSYAIAAPRAERRRRDAQARARHRPLRRRPRSHTALAYDLGRLSPLPSATKKPPHAVAFSSWP
jgi:hypothetical protein